MDLIRIAGAGSAPAQAAVLTDGAVLRLPDTPTIGELMQLLLEGCGLIRRSYNELREPHVDELPQALAEPVQSDRNQLGRIHLRAAPLHLCELPFRDALAGVAETYTEMLRFDLTARLACGFLDGAAARSGFGSCQKAW